MLTHLRLATPADLTDRVRALLVDDDRTTNVTLQRGASLDPVGDVVEADLAREASNDILDSLEELGLAGRGGITLTEVAAAPFDAGRRVERAAVGEADDSVVWDLVVEQAEQAAQPSLTYFAFLVIATALAGIAVFTDSPILVVGAMVVGPDFAPVAAMCTGLVLRRWALAGRAAGLLAGGYVAAIVAVAALTLLGRVTGLVTPELVSHDRPATAFIWHPDHWAFVVAVLAGAAGALATTGSKSNALVGVFISVTTVPAAGNLAVALVTGVTQEASGALLQLGTNVAGMILACTLVLALQRAVLRHTRLRPTGISR